MFHLVQGLLYIKEKKKVNRRTYYGYNMNLKENPGSNEWQYFQQKEKEWLYLLFYFILFQFITWCFLSIILYDIIKNKLIKYLIYLVSFPNFDYFSRKITSKWMRNKGSNNLC